MSATAKTAPITDHELIAAAHPSSGRAAANPTNSRSRISHAIYENGDTIYFVSGTHTRNALMARAYGRRISRSRLLSCEWINCPDRKVAA